VTSDVEPRLAGLLRQAIAGDEAAYRRFLSEVSTVVRGYVRRRVGRSSSVDAEDVLQEVLLALHLKRHTWRSDEALLPWVYAIARYKLIDAFRRRGQRIDVDLDDVIDVLEAPQDEQTASSRDIERALASLTDGQRAVVTAISVDGQSIRETADRLKMNETAVRVALHRGLAAIAAKFGRQE